MRYLDLALAIASAAVLNPAERNSQWRTFTSVAGADGSAVE
jgi:hypothetical protein